MMDLGCYRFMVGEIECFVISDGTGGYSDPARFLFVNAPREELRQTLLKYNVELDTWREWVSPHLCLAIRTGGRCILVDTGNGQTLQKPDAGKILQNLQEAGIRLGDIDTVILTHAHADHIGGVTDADGRLVFENARHVMSRTEWEFWNSEAGREESDAHLKLAPLADRIELVSGEMQIVPGVRVMPAAGHTLGNLVVSISSGGETLLHLGDVVTHPLHLEHPKWNMLLDYDREGATQTRRRLLEQASVDRIRVMGYHFDFPGLGYVKKKGAAWEWKPLNVPL